LPRESAKFGYTLLFGAERRQSWEHLERADASRLRAAGLAATSNRSFGSVGPRVGIELALPLGSDWNASLASAVATLFRSEINSSGTETTTVRPVFSTTFAVGAAF
jgi:hypothetical protein